DREVQWWSVNRAMMLGLLFAVIAITAARAQPPSAPPPSPAVPRPTPNITSAESPRSDPAEQPKAEKTKTDDAKKDETKSEKRDPASEWPSNPLAERLNLKPTIQVRGRIEADAVMAAQSQESKATIGDLQNGYGFRRVRLGAQGNIGDSASWVSEVELAGGNVRLRDVFVGLDAIPGVRQVRVGFFREPYSLE